MSKATFSSNGYSADAAICIDDPDPIPTCLELYDFLRIPSVSTRPEHVDDIKAAADWLAANMETAGLETSAFSCNRPSACLQRLAACR